MSVEAASETFRARFGQAPTVASRAPGRINLIGEHTDYNGGFVFPAAIDHRLYLVARPSGGDASRLYSNETGAGEVFDARTADVGGVSGWTAYVAGMAWVLREAGYGEMPNIEAVVDSDIPIGSGISSSAALELAAGVAYRELAGLTISNSELALLAQRCENEFVGVACGIMDQMASAMGRAGHAMFLDSRTLEIEYVAVPNRLTVMVCDTRTPRSLSASAYNERRRQCETAARAMGVPALRDADETMLEAAAGRLDPVVQRRARHVISENQRCLAFVRALEEGDEEQLGELMRASHESLRDDYEVSSRELDAMAESAWDAPGCVGARMTGAGFGGACVALVRDSDASLFRESTLAGYRDRTGREGNLLACKIVEGACARPMQEPTGNTKQ